MPVYFFVVNSPDLTCVAAFTNTKLDHTPIVAFLSAITRGQTAQTTVVHGDWGFFPLTPPLGSGHLFGTCVTVRFGKAQTQSTLDTLKAAIATDLRTLPNCTVYVG